MVRVPCLLTIAVYILCITRPGSAQLLFTKILIDTNFAQYSQPTYLNSADLNGDNATDIIVSSPDIYTGDSSLFIWYQNNGDDIFTKAVIDTDIVGGGAFYMADLDKDTDEDIVISASGKLTWFENDSSGNFVKNLIDYISDARVLCVDDIDKDLDEDIILLNPAGIYWQINNGSQEFTLDTVDAISVVDNGLAVTDLDSDLDNDIVGTIYINPDRILVWYENDGNQNFTIDTVDIYPVSLNSLVVDDLDDDGDQDIITLYGNRENAIVWYNNDGSENFSRDTISVSFVRFPTSLSIADIDNDGDKDLIVTGGNNTVGEVVYYENDGNENFLKRTIDDSPGNRQRVIVADIDSDNDPDVFVTNTYPFQVVMYRNDGLTSNVPEKIYNTPHKFSLAQNFPNPFNPTTEIRYSLATPAHVVIDIFNILGQKIRTLVDRRQPPGSYHLVLDSQLMPSGIYYYRLRAGGFGALRKMVVLK